MSRLSFRALLAPRAWIVRPVSHADAGAAAWDLAGAPRAVRIEMPWTR